MSCADPKSREDASARKGDTLQEFSVRMLSAALTPGKQRRILMVMSCWSKERKYCLTVHMDLTQLL